MENLIYSMSINVDKTLIKRQQDWAHPEIAHFWQRLIRGCFLGRRAILLTGLAR